MEGLKNPAIVLSSVSLLGVLGSVGYFYKRIDGLEEELQKFSDVVERMGKRMGKEDEATAQLTAVAKNLRQFGEALSTFQGEVASLEGSIKEQDRKISLIIAALNEEGIAVELKKKKGKSKKKELTSSDSEDSEDDFLKQLKTKKKK